MQTPSNAGVAGATTSGVRVGGVPVGQAIPGGQGSGGAPAVPRGPAPQGILGGPSGMPTEAQQAAAQAAIVPEGAGEHQGMQGVNDDAQRNVKHRVNGPHEALLGELEGNRKKLSVVSDEAPSGFKAFTELNVIESRVRQQENVESRSEIQSVSNRQEASDIRKYNLERQLQDLKNNPS
eukprot:3109805-Pyramimonas_sp.AAC.1